MGLKQKYYFIVICAYNNVQCKMCKAFNVIFCHDNGKHLYSHEIQA